MKFLFWIDTFIERFSKVVLVVSLFAMLFLSVLAIFMRWFDESLSWIEPLVRHLVFLSTFLGGVVATGRGGHIAIDIISQSLRAKGKEKSLKIIKKAISFISFCVLLWLSWTSLYFIEMEFMYGREVFWGIHSGFLVSIIPFGSILIAYRFLIRTFFLVEEEGH